MKSKHYAGIIFSGLFFLSIATLPMIVGCAGPDGKWTPHFTGKLTDTTKANLAVFESVAAQALTNAVVTGAVNATAQLTTTGKVDTRQLASAEIYGFASQAQGYVGQIVTQATLTSAFDNPSVKAAANASLPLTVAVTQVGVDALNAQAAKLAAPVPK